MLYQASLHKLGVRSNSDWSEPLTILRRKWGQVPLKENWRGKSAKMLCMPDDKLLKVWDNADRSQSKVRQWYRDWYAGYMKKDGGVKILDVGCGLGFDTVWFEQQGAYVTFMDIIKENVEVVRRICVLKGIEADFVYLDSFEHIMELGEYDFIMALGSLHHAPKDVVAPEIRVLVKHLRVGGRWLQLAYPKCRWERNGCLPFSVWGKVTDGSNTPWAEWYDVAKLSNILGMDFELVMYREFHNGDFNWFDFKKTS